MTRQTLGLSVAMVLAAALIGLAEPKGPTVTVKGEAVDMWCYMEGGEHGPTHKACATACAKGGNPIGIVDAKGDIYLTAGGPDPQTTRALLFIKNNEGGSG